MSLFALYFFHRVTLKDGETLCRRGGIEILTKLCIINGGGEFFYSESFLEVNQVNRDLVSADNVTVLLSCVSYGSIFYL